MAGTDTACIDDDDDDGTEETTCAEDLTGCCLYGYMDGCSDNPLLVDYYSES